MKKFLLAITVCCSFQVYSQDPDLVRTWYLTFVQTSDKATPYYVSAISPAIQPYLEVFGDYTFMGEGACNSFEGIATFPYPNVFETTAFSSTSADCGIQIHNSFEDSYFYFMEFGNEYEIYNNADGLILYFYTPLMGAAIFQDYPLSTSSFLLNNITLHPNPVKSNLYLNTNTVVLSEIEVFSASGKKVLSKSGHLNSVDLSSLKSGIYFLKLHTEDAYTVKKIIKN